MPGPETTPVAESVPRSGDAVDLPPSRDDEERGELPPAAVVTPALTERWSVSARCGR
ncbi:hypothetical protein [Lentzea cavernae]|uniref:hypothetical protein n=1 Tax=Lentzea cavernae TaxID=2020703 RepID=UPI001E449E95|nr:hypothetical protein [Lentzea cavernae]